MGAITYFTLVFAPVMALFLYFYLGKKYDSHFGSLILKGYLAGMISAFIYFLAFTMYRALGLTEISGLKRMLMFSFVIIGFSSEFSKFILYRYYIIPKKEIDRPIHAITFSVILALGFSTLTQVFFFLNLFELQSYYPSVMYSYVNVPSNLIFAIIMGFFVGMSRFINAKFIYSIIGLFGATFFHGIFKFCLVTKDFKLLSLFAFGSSLIVLVLIIKALFTNPETLS